MNKMTNNEAAKKYFEKAKALAHNISQIAEIRNSFKYISERADDCGDPAFFLDDALVKLGEALASALLYANDYENNINE